MHRADNFIEGFYRVFNRCLNDQIHRLGVVLTNLRRSIDRLEIEIEMLQIT